MENEKQIVTLTDIKKYFWKEERNTVISLACIFALFCWPVFVVKIPVIKAILIVYCLLSLWGVIWCLYNLFQIKKDTYIKIRTDELVNKAEGVYTFLRGHNTHRLYFRQDHYDLWIYNSHTGRPLWSDIHNMEKKTIYDTAFVGDIFTLVSVRKRVYLVFNNKLFDIRDDL